MRIYAIGDLHLSFSDPKPMDIFGEGWRDHVARLSSAWSETVTADDVVLLPGDISWAMTLSGAAPDLAFIGALPGQKILLRGNHDYWWNAKTRVAAALPDSMRMIQNDSLQIGDWYVCGTRGWSLPDTNGFTADDQKIYDREAQRLALSLSSVPQGARKLAMTHFPPLTPQLRDTAFTALLENAGVEACAYAHLHGAAHKGAFEGVHNGVRYTLVSGDHLGFRPKRIV